MLMTNGFFLSVLEAKQKKFHIQEIGFTRKFSYLGILLVFFFEDGAISAIPHWPLLWRSTIKFNISFCLC